MEERNLFPINSVYSIKIESSNSRKYYASASSGFLCFLGVGVLAFALNGLIAETVDAAPVDLNTWTAESYPAVSSFDAGNWVVASDGSSVEQTVNGQPTLFFSDFDAFGTELTGKIKVDTSGDDDFIGFVLGFDPGDTSNTDADFLLVDWKQGTQFFNFGSPSTTPGSTAFEGLAVSRVTGIPTADELWGHVDFSENSDGGVEELQRGTTLGSTGWDDFVEFEFTFDFGPSDLEVFVNGVKELDIAGSFDNGRLGFYNFSQSTVNYSAFEVEEGSFDPEPTPVSVPVPAGWMFLAGGLLGLGALTRRGRLARQ